VVRNPAWTAGRLARTSQGREDADQLIDCPVLPLWDEDFSAVGQANVALGYGKGLTSNVRGRRSLSAGTCARRNAPDIVDAELLGFLTDPSS
jgi:hypothetical protein